MDKHDCKNSSNRSNEVSSVELERKRRIIPMWYLLTVQSVNNFSYWIKDIK